MTEESLLINKLAVGDPLISGAKPSHSFKCSHLWGKAFSFLYRRLIHSALFLHLVT